MLIIPPPIYRPRSRPARSKAPAPDGPPILIQSVTASDDWGRAYWVLDTVVNLIGPPIGLRVLVDGVWLDPIDATIATTNTLDVYYDAEQSLADALFSVIQIPQGIVEAARFVLPQAGTILPP